jgi:iron complex outermembrane receptor protein
VPVVPCAADLAALGLKDGPATYQSDKLLSWEIGSKNKVFDNTVSIASSAYIARWKNIQQSVTLPICQFPFTSNLGEAEIRGFDIQVAASPIHGLTIDSTVGYTHARYTKSVYVSPTATVVQTGNSIPISPWTASIGLQYDFHLIGDKTYIRGDYQFASRDRALTPATDPRNNIFDPGAITPQESRFVSARAGVLIRNFDVSLFVDNLLDDHPVLYQFRTGLTYEALTTRPRTIGITITHRM